MPVLLGGVFKLTNNRSPAESLAGIRNKPEYQRLETARFVQRHGITRFAPNPFFPVNTLVLMRGAIAAQRLGVFERYVDEIYRHMWAEPKKLDDPDVLRAALVESRLDGDAILGLAQTPGSEERTAGEYAALGGTRHVRIANVLRRRGDLLRQGRLARRRRGDRGNAARQCMKRSRAIMPDTLRLPSREARDKAIPTTGLQRRWRSAPSLRSSQ